ncbi:MAG: hypothetical protein QF832_21245, partial [SAR324 cluster bacterium]|nr:hypothetical protein [SAR324 cluster bacterium]
AFFSQTSTPAQPPEREKRLSNNQIKWCLVSIKITRFAFNAKSPYAKLRIWFTEFRFQSGNLNFPRKFTDGDYQRVLRMMEESKMILAETDF